MLRFAFCDGDGGGNGFPNQKTFDELSSRGGLHPLSCVTVVLPRNSVLQIPHRLLCGFTMQLHARPEQTHFGPAAFSLVLSHVVHVWGVPTEELREVLKRELSKKAPAGGPSAAAHSPSAAERSRFWADLERPSEVGGLEEEQEDDEELDELDPGSADLVPGPQERAALAAKFDGKAKLGTELLDNCF